MEKNANRASERAKKARVAQVNLPVFTGTMPVATFGTCINATIKTTGCRNYHVDLAEGKCQRCWDDNRLGTTHRKSRKRKAHPALAEALARVRGSL